MDQGIEDARTKLAAAEAELKRWNDRWENYDGNNPNKYHSDIRRAQRDVDFARDRLKRLEARA